MKFQQPLGKRCIQRIMDSINISYTTQILVLRTKGQAGCHWFDLCRKYERLYSRVKYSNWTEYVAINIRLVSSWRFQEWFGNKDVCALSVDFLLSQYCWFSYWWLIQDTRCTEQNAATVKPSLSMHFEAGDLSIGGITSQIAVLNDLTHFNEHPHQSWTSDHV